MNSDSGSSGQPILFEKKCEREFRKLLESTGSDQVKTKCDFLPSNEKKRKVCEAQSTEVFISNSLNNPQSPIHNGDETVNEIFKTSPCPLLPSVQIIEQIRRNDIDLQSLSMLFNHGSRKIKCQNFLNLATFCLEDINTLQLRAILDVVNQSNYVHEAYDLDLCYSMLLLALTKKNLSLSQSSAMENLILKVTDAQILTGNELGYVSEESSLISLQPDLYLSASRLCQLLDVQNLDTSSIDVIAICCSALRNLCQTQSGEKFTYSESTLKLILGMIGRSTQDIMSEYLVTEEFSDDPINASALTVNQCLFILEHISSTGGESCLNFEHEDFSILHCLTRLMSWCLSFLFHEGGPCQRALVENSLSSFHLTTIISILKILSTLSFVPDQFDNFTNVKGLIERIMICIFKFYFHSSENHFDVLILALEVLINLFIKHRKAFAMTCLRKFPINASEKVIGIEALLKILENNLTKIAEIGANSLYQVRNNGEEINEEENAESSASEMNVPEAPDNNESDKLDLAHADLELSTIVSYISILISYFMELKTCFAEFVREKLSAERSSEASKVTSKFLRFTSITGGMPVTGVLLLTHAIRKMTALHDT